MKRHRTSSHDDAPGDDPADLYFGLSHTAQPDRRAERKERQLCRQAHEALSQAFAELSDPCLQRLFVCDVSPAPDASRLAVSLAAPVDLVLDDVTARLQRVEGWLRSEVAAVITRKRVPTIVYEVMAERIDDDEVPS